MYVLEFRKLAENQIFEESTSATLGEIQTTHRQRTSVDRRQTHVQQLLCQCGQESENTPFHEL